jgi:transposase
MAPYSMDLRSRVLRDADAGLPSKAIAAKYLVSRAWVDRVKQRRREHGEIGPRSPSPARENSRNDAAMAARLSTPPALPNFHHVSGL